ncbi:MAG: DUF480 domain-containing protein [Pirellulaceae bacterium]
MNEDSQKPEWEALNRFERRVAGVLIEKSKTTPDVYPMSLNAITNACNQKSNRSPLMNLTQDEVQDTLDRLREKGAVVEVHGDGRVARFRHQMYDWLAVDKPELAVMCELLLRGQQTLGDLRARVSRMEPLKTQDELRPIVQSLLVKKLMIELTPPGRGQVVTHNLYQPEELAKVERQVADSPSLVADDEGESATQDSTNSSGLELRVAELEAQLETVNVRLAKIESLLE